MAISFLSLSVGWGRGVVYIWPFTDMDSTIVTLIVGYPQVDIIYESDLDGDKIALDTREIKAELDGVSINDPEVLELIRDLFEKNE